MDVRRAIARSEAAHLTPEDLAALDPHGAPPAEDSRRAALLAAAAVLLSLLLAGLAPARGGDPPAPVVTSVGLVVSDLERSLAFFREVLDFELLAKAEHGGPQHEALEGVFALRTLEATLRLGDERLTLTQYLAPRGRPIPADSRSHDEWFQHVAIVVSDMDAAYARLRTAQVEHASSGPQRLPDWNPNAGGIEAFYFKDPDGHVLEVIAFPPGKGDPRWPALAARGGLFLGIDHTAIVVRDTDEALRFWRDGLGLHVAGASENWGPEQERLNGVFGARLRITALRGAAGPGVEFLEYLAPSDGRPAPVDARANDLWHWETRLAVAGLDDLAARLRAAGGAWVSPGPVALGNELALLVRTPDGHAVEVHGRASQTEQGP
jgi:catechol 2,3-dioxygenase-like lactoylglutathione lyase family enzyme